MKDLYNAIRERLNTEVPALRWIDLDFGQLDVEMPPVQFPCALLGIQLPRTTDENVQQTIQRVSAVINIRIGFNFSGNTDQNTPEAHRNTSLEYFDLVQAVYEALQGWSDGTFNKLSRQSAREERRGNQIKVINLPFGSSYQDTSAVPA